MAGTLQAEVTQLLQISGPEGTYGVAEDADKRLLSLKADADPKFHSEDDVAQGVKSVVGEIIGKEWSEIGLSGNAAYNDLAWLLAMFFCTPVIATPGGATNARTHTHFPTMTDEDTLDAFTIEYGKVADATVMAGLRMDEGEWTFDPTKGGIDFKGKAIGKKQLDGQAFTASPTQIAKVSLTNRQWGVIIASTEAGLTDTANRVKPLLAKFSLKNRQNQVFTGDETEPSFEDTVEDLFKPMFELTIRKGSDSNDYMDDLRASTTKYVRLYSTGPDIESGQPYSWDIRMPFQFREPKRQAAQKAACVVFGLQGVYDPTFNTTGGTILSVLKNKIAAL